MIKILIVDDEKDVELMFLQKFRNEIKNNEMALFFCLDATKALKFMSSLDPFDIILVLSDINMPGMNGLDLLSKIQETYPALKVFMISAYGDQQNIKEAAQRGANDFITKPVNFQLLKQRILAIAGN